MMKTRLTLGLCLLLSLPATAQQEECFEPSRKAGIEKLKNGEYVEAKNIFENLHYCPDMPQKNDIQTFLERCNEGLNPLTRNKTEAYSKRLSQYEQHFFGYCEGLMAVYNKADYDKWLNAPNDETNIDYVPKIGFIDENANLVIPCKYENSDFYSMSLGYSFSEGMAAVIKRYPNGPLSRDESGRIRYGWGFIDKKGNEVIPFNLVDAHNFSEGIAAVQYPFDEGWCFIDKTGKRINDKTYPWAGAFKEGMCPVMTVKDSDLYGFINKSGELVIPAIYDRVTYFENGVCAVFKDDNEYEAALLNKDGFMVGDFTFRPEYLRSIDIDIYAVDKYNSEEYDKCFMAILALEKRMAEENKPLEDPNDYKIEPFMKGMIFMNGYGNIPKDLRKAFESFKIAKESNSMYMLACCYLDGLGTGQDYALCKHYLEEAIRDNSWDSHGYVSYNTRLGEAKGKKGDVALHPTQEDAMYLLGQLHYYGYGCTKNPAYGLKLLKQAADSGHKDARELLDKWK